MDEEETIFTKLYKVMSHWDEKFIPFEAALGNLGMLANFKVKFENIKTF